MSATEYPRRGFLRQLCTLPMLGGGITLLGAPTAVAEPVTTGLLDAYYDFLTTECNFLCREKPRPWNGPSLDEPPRHLGRDHPLYQAWAQETVAAHDAWKQRIEADNARRAALPVFSRSPSTRAALVLSAVGFDWKGG